MATANLTLHCAPRGGHPRSTRAAIPCPPAEGRWLPGPAPRGSSTTARQGPRRCRSYAIEKMKLGLTRDDQRFWGTLVLKSTIVSGVSLACAVASSLDKSCSLRFGYGHSVFVCDNGAWRVEETIARKHTTNGVTKYQEALCLAVSKIESFKQQEAARIKALTYRDLKDVEAESLILKCYEAEILSPRTVHTAIKEWRTPSFEEFADRTAWSLFNAITLAIGKSCAPRTASHRRVHARADDQARRKAALLPDPAEPQYALPVWTSPRWASGKNRPKTLCNVRRMEWFFPVSPSVQSEADKQAEVTSTVRSRRGSLAWDGELLAGMPAQAAADDHAVRDEEAGGDAPAFVQEDWSVDGTAADWRNCDPRGGGADRCTQLPVSSAMTYDETAKCVNRQNAAHRVAQKNSRDVASVLPLATSVSAKKLG